MWALTEVDSQIYENTGPTIHFISHMFPTNAADLTFNAGVYFKDLFFSYPCVWHRILDVDFNLIKTNDWVIFSGGDIYHPAEVGLFNKLIFKTGGRVIGWGCGYNLREGNDKLLDTSLNKRGFALFTTRDYNFISEFGDPERYLPCVSCMQPGFNIRTKIDREVVVIEHKWFPIHDFPEYEKSNNSIQALQLLNFIASSNVVITNSYHMTYWATLLSKKVILTGKYASKFDYFKYQPTVYSGDLQSDIECATTYPEALEECRRLNIEFAKEVISLIQTDDGQSRDLSETYGEFMKSANGYFSYEDVLGQINNIHKRIDDTHKYADDAHRRIDDTHKYTDDAHRRIDELWGVIFFTRLKKICRKILNKLRSNGK